MAYDDLVFTTLTGLNSDFSSTASGARDGYRAYAATVNTGLQRLISNDVYMQHGLSRLPGQSQDLYRIYADIGSGLAASSWQPIATSTLPTSQRTTATNSYSNPVWVKFPDVPTCEIYNIEYIAACPLATQLPSSSPFGQLWSRPAASVLAADMTLLATFANNPTVLATYQQTHRAYTATFASSALTNGTEYWLALHGDPTTSGYVIYKAWINIVRS